MKKNWKLLALSSVMIVSMAACAGTGSPVTNEKASFQVTGQGLGSSYADGSQIQPAEAIVKNTSAVAGTPPTVLFNISSDLEFINIDNALYNCASPSDILVSCVAKDGAKLEASTQVSLKPQFDLTFKNVPEPAALQSKSHISGHFAFPISISGESLANPILLPEITVTPAVSGFDLIIDKTVSKPFIIDGAGNGSGEFTITSTVVGSSPPSYVKIQDPPLPAGYFYNLPLIISNNPAWNCVLLSGGTVLSCKAINPLVHPPLIVSIKITALTNTNTQGNCPWLYPLLGDSVQNNNHLGPTPYAKPCTKYTPIKPDLAISKTQLAPITTPANSFYWGMSGKYQIVVSNTTFAPASGPIVVSDVLNNIPAGSVLAFTTNLADIYPAANGWIISGTTATNTNGWVCTGIYPNITCTYPGPIAGNSSAPPLILGVQVKPEDPALANGETNCATLVNQSPKGGVTPINDGNNQNNQSCVTSQNMYFEPQIDLHRAESVVQASNGDFIVVGSSDSATRGKQFMVRRYAPDGITPLWDKVEDFTAGFDTALDVALDSKGNIVVVGYAGGPTATNTQAILMKYDPSGSPMAGFPVTVGTLTDNNHDYFGSVAVDSSDRIVTGGFDGNEQPSNHGSRTRFVLHRFSSVGIPDGLFGTAGRVSTDVLTVLGHAQYLNGLSDVVIEEDKGIYRIYAGGLTRNTSNLSTFAITRYQQSGALDPSWGGAGAIETYIQNGAIIPTLQAESIIYELGLQTVDTIKRLVATGTAGNDFSDGMEANRSCVVTRYNLTNGAIDTLFSGGGIVSFGKSNLTDGKSCTAMAINKTTSEIAVGGSSFNSTTGSDYMARKLSANGVLGTLYVNNDPNTYGPPLIREDRSQGVVWTNSSPSSLMTVGFSYKDVPNLDEWVVKNY
jgi:uncharacterized delta-60 repeat protein